MRLKLTLIFSLLAIGLSSLTFCSAERREELDSVLEDVNEEINRVTVAAERMQEYLPLLENKNVGLLVNQSSLVGKRHLLDTLLASGVKVKRIFSPEHGFRGDAADGEKVRSSVDRRTGVPIVSLYGKSKKPSQESLEGLDIVIFDIQDVGVRFYTYLSSMHLMMEACAEKGIPLVLLDRPNPNAWYIDGPVLDMDYSSFVGMHPVPLVYGMSIGEYAMMINGEEWLTDSLFCDLRIVKMDGWSHTSQYELPVWPSPNLPNQKAVLLYPHLALFEGTIVSCGRGTDKPFQMIGYPEYPDTTFSFTPISKPGFSKYPKFEGATCYGLNFSDLSLESLYSKQELDLQAIHDLYSSYEGEDFFNDYLEKLIGTELFQTQLEEGKSVEEIKESWEPGLKIFKGIRQKYLLYD